jgi:hypothetical protein
MYSTAIFRSNPGSTEDKDFFGRRGGKNDMGQQGRFVHRCRSWSFGTYYLDAAYAFLVGGGWWVRRFPFYTASSFFFCHVSVLRLESWMSKRAQKKINEGGGGNGKAATRRIHFRISEREVNIRASVIIIPNQNLST